MKMNLSAVAAIMLLLCVNAVHAEERFGVTVYPGAKYDANNSKFLKQSGIAQEAASFHTTESVAKVTEFYKTQQGFKQIGSSNESSMFTKNNINVTIQRPWMDMATGKMMNDTLISIVK